LVQIIIYVCFFFHFFIRVSFFTLTDFVSEEARKKIGEGGKGEGNKKDSGGGRKKMEMT